jgi:isopentenyl-diphosphate delta-isomerase
MSSQIARRKAEHVSICLNQDVNYQKLTTGFEKIQLSHCALPELDFKEINTKIPFLGKVLAFPLIITGMTGGFKDARTLNQQLAEVCQDYQLALGLGSQRQALENSDYWASFLETRRLARQIPLLGNIGAAQIISAAQRRKVLQMMDRLQPDAIAVHLNPLQEMVQPEGDLNFKGVLAGLQALVKDAPVPIIAKETGAGISGKVAQRLKEVGISYIDLSGAGGTSWAAVEAYRTDDPHFAQKFRDWGIPTARCLLEVAPLDGLQLIASGGIRDGVDVAKACVLGALLGGMALPVLKILVEQGPAGLSQAIEKWHREFKIAMFLTGCQRVSDLAQVDYFLLD